MLRPRPCRFCRRWFVRDVRVGARQRVCSKPQCQRRRRSATQASWRKRNPEYAAAYRIARRREQERPEAPQPRAPLDALPWDVAQDEFTPAGAEFVAALGRVLVRHTKDEIGRQVGVVLEKSGRHAPPGEKDQIRV